MSRVPVRFLLALFLVGVLLSLFTLRYWAGSGTADVRGVPAGHQEIAWISPATNGDAWERLIAALELLQREARAPAQPGTSAPALDPTFRVNFDNAFLPLTADVPEVSLSFADAPDAKLWIRWYKLSGENPSSSWFEKLSRRASASVGHRRRGDDGPRLFQARALQKIRAAWPGPAPLYFITTATAERYDPREFQTGEIPHNTWPKLMEVYAGRTFRFCFTNTRMVEAVLDFVSQNLQLAAQRRAIRRSLPASSLRQRPSARSPCSVPPATCNLFSYPRLFGRTTAIPRIWARSSCNDSRTRPPPKMCPSPTFTTITFTIASATFWNRTPKKHWQWAFTWLAIGNCATSGNCWRCQRALSAPGAFCVPCAGRLPWRHATSSSSLATALSSITSTGIASLPGTSRICPSHWSFSAIATPSTRLPALGRKDTEGTPSNTGTQDVLLNRDIIETLIHAAFDGQHLVADAEVLHERLRHTRWSKGRVLNEMKESTAGVPFFDATGNRQPDTGEHIVWLRPVLQGSRNLPEAFLTVWRQGGTSPGEDLAHVHQSAAPFL